MGCSQAVRQRFLVACTVGSNPTTPANTHYNFITERDFVFLSVYSGAFQGVRIPQIRNMPYFEGILPEVWRRHLHGRWLGVFNAAGIVRRWYNQVPGKAPCKWSVGGPLAGSYFRNLIVPSPHDPGSIKHPQPSTVQMPSPDFWQNPF